MPSREMCKHHVRDMKNFDLSLRLQAIAEQVPSKSKLADIGSDHALLPTWLALHERCVFAVAGELNEGPYQAAQKQVEAAGVSHIVKVRKGDGLQVIHHHEVDTITIAGMGGALIASILENGKGKLSGVKRLILQPNVAADHVRSWLIHHQWVLCDELIIKEEGRYYEILVACPEDSLHPAMFPYEQPGLPCQLEIPLQLQLKMGPLLLRKASEAFVEKWEEEASKMHHICQQMKRSSTASARKRLQEQEQQLKLIMEVITCLQTGKR